MPAVTNPPDQRPPADGGRQAPAEPPVPFVRAALPKLARAKQWKQVVELSTDVQPLPTLNVPAHGFLRNTLFRLQLDSIAGGTYSADGLAAVVRSINFADTGGSDVIVPLNGHDLKMVNKWVPSGGYSDPAILFPTTTEMFFTLPLEISERDALGSLPNMDQSSQYSIDVSLAPIADAFSVAPTAAPTATLEAYYEAWSPPQTADFPGRSVEPQPPALNTTQYISKHRRSIPAAGDHNHILERRGNLMRSLLLIGRTEAGARSNSVLPEAIRFRWDGREMYDFDTDVLRFQMRQRGGMSVDTGVLLLDWTHEFDGKIGGELRDAWLRTMKSSTLEVDLLGCGAAGQISFLTVDVAPTGNVYVG